MGQLFGTPDNFQQDPPARNSALAALLSSTWDDKNIKSVSREPVPSNPPDPNGPKRGQWVAEVP